jgi:hypothetical protein
MGLVPPYIFFRIILPDYSDFNKKTAGPVKDMVQQEGKASHFQA